VRNIPTEQRELLAVTPILITSSITPHDATVRLLDPQRRLFHAIESIEQWVRVAQGSRLVLCDGSNFDFRPIVKERFRKAKIECLLFENDPSKIATYGRGYGEGEIISFALRHSEFLSESDAFAKCSSKLWVENYSQCLSQWRGKCLFFGHFKNAFSLIKPIEMLQVDTRFYITEKKFYLENLLNAHKQIGTSPSFGLEDYFHQRLLNIQQKKYLFSIAPVIRGVGGGIADYYKDNWSRVLKEKARLEIVKKSKNFKEFFNL